MSPIDSSKVPADRLTKPARRARLDRRNSAWYVDKLVAILVFLGGISGIVFILGIFVFITSEGIGFLVGLAMRFAGKGITPVFGTVAAILSLFGCIVGNILTYTWFIADMEGLTFMEVASQLNLAVIIGLLTSTFAVMDILFYGLAAYFGYKYAFRQVTQADIDRVTGKGF